MNVLWAWDAILAKIDHKEIISPIYYVGYSAREEQLLR